jgi:TonB family protein
MNTWATAVFDAIRGNWSLAKDFPVRDIRNFRTTIRLRVLEDGSISEPRITKASGDADFDESCMKALALTRKVSPPPASMVARVQRGLGIALVFDGASLASCGLTCR